MAAQKIAQASQELSVEEVNPFSWRLTQLFGAFPAVLDRHVTEFFPHLFPDGAYYGRTLGVDVYSVEDAISGGNRTYAENRDFAYSEEPLPDDYFEWISGEHEQVVDIIDSVRNDTGSIYSANLPNMGQVPNLPDEAIVESPAVATGAGLRPIMQPPLPVGIVGTLATRMAWVDTTVEGALEGSRTKFIQALVLDGSARSLEMAGQLADELLAAHSEHLLQFQQLTDTPLTP